MTDTRKEFEDWFEKSYGAKPKYIGLEKEQYATMYADVCFAVWQDQQSHIDQLEQQLAEVKADLDSYINASNEYANEVIKLEAALVAKDDALQHINDHWHHTDLGGGESVISILDESFELAKEALTIKPSTEHLEAYFKKRLGEPVAYAYINEDKECEQIEWTQGTDYKYPEFTPLYALKEE